MKLPFMVSLQTFLGLGEKKPPMTSQAGRKAKVIRKLIAQGHITQREIANMGDNSPSKTIWRMRQDGVLFADASDPKGFEDVPNASGEGTHRRYKWTNKLPASWEKPKTERRKRQRGCK